ncbi:MAG: NADH-quinone oxidoreductase subunit N [Candidatus Hydrothermarchaeota archaeon]
MAQLLAVLPEVLVASTALAVLLLDLVTDRKKALGYLSLLGLLAALGAVVNTYGVRSALFDGMFLIDGFSFFFKLTFLAVALLVVLGSITYVVRSESQGEYYVLLLLATLGMMLVASAGDLITLFIGIELASISTYVLAGFRKDPQTTEAAAKYFIMGALSSALILFGISLIYGMTGTTSIYQIAYSLNLAISQGGMAPVAYLAMVFLIAGFGFKMAAVPFHMWAPDTYQGAPTTITAFLAAGSKKMGFAAAFKVFAIALVALRVEWSLLFGILAAVTMTLGNVVALNQKNIKRMLAYSSIGHAGYILVGLALLTPLGFAGGLLHVLTHAFMKGGAFLAVALLSYAMVGEDIEEYIGLGKRAPVTAFALLIFLLSLIGIPPLAGFWSKFLLVTAALEVGGWAFWLAVLLVLNSAISLFYYARIIKYMYMTKPEKELGRLEEPLPILAALVLAVLAIFAIGLAPQTFIDLTIDAVGALYQL